MEHAAIDWYRCKIDKEVLRDLTAKKDSRGWLQAGSFILAYLCTASLALWLFLNRLWLPMIAACYLHSILVNFMYSAVHELSHGTVFKTKWLNEGFFYLFGFLAWKDPVHFRISHSYHHQVTVFRGVDKEVVQAAVKTRLNWYNYLTWLTFDIDQFRLWVGRLFLHAFGRPDVDYFTWDPLLAADDPRRRRLVFWARAMLGAHALLLALFVVLHLWVLIYLVTFSVFFGSFYFNRCGTLQHTGLGESLPDWRLVCYSFKAGPLTRWLYWNMNYHTEHHMYGAVPFHSLARLRRAIEGDLPPILPGIRAGWRLLRSIKERQAKEPGYTHVPALPGGS